jgi:hypothetical protein
MSIQYIQQYLNKVAYKAQVIDLLGKVCRIRMETMKIVEEMEG